ncbi:MAG: hypothetical protein ABEK29_00395 [Bradymonadaceae bacterium]
MDMRRLIWTGLLAAAMLLASGCSMLMGGGSTGVTDREVQKIKPHPARNVTIIKTRDQYGVGDEATYETRYWYCKQDKSQLQCRRACGKDAVCPKSSSSIRASLAPRASMLEDKSSQASKPASDTSGSTTADKSSKSGPAGAADKMTDSNNESAGDKSGSSKSGTDKSGSEKSKDKGGDQ